MGLLPLALGLASTVATVRAGLLGQLMAMLLSALILVIS
jgi:hypothetical protein